MKNYKIIIIFAILLSLLISLYAEKSKEALASETACKADTLYNNKDYKQAIVEYEKALVIYQEAITDVTPFDAEITAVYEKIYKAGVLGKDYPNAAKYGELLLSKKTDDENLVKNLALIERIYLKNTPKALELWTTYEAKYQTNIAKKAIAEIYEKAKDYPNAILWYQKTYEQSKNSDILVEIADMYIKNNQVTAAAKVYEDYLATNPAEDGLSLIYKNLGALYQKSKNNTKAIIYFEKYLNLTPDSKIALFVASEYYTKKDYINTIKYCNLILDKDANSPDALYFRGLAYYYSNKKEDAKTDLSKIEKNPKYGQSASQFLKLIASGK